MEILLFKPQRPVSIPFKRTQQILIFFLLLSLFWPNGLLGHSLEYKDIVKARLMADTNAIEGSKPFTLGIYFKIEDGWHIYWENPGDDGLPIEVKWSLPEGFKLSPFYWPVPSKFEEGGDLISFGYAKETMLLTKVTPPSSLRGKFILLEASLDWFACKSFCILGSAKVNLKLPIGKFTPSEDYKLIAQYKKKLPRPATDVPFNLKSATALKQTPNNWLIKIDLEGRKELLQNFFPRTIKNFTPRHSEIKIKNLSILIPITTDKDNIKPPKSISGILITDHNAYEFQAEIEISNQNVKNQ